MFIITHRGLEPLNKDFKFFESSREAFLNQLERGYGLEFDINFTGDNFCFISHDCDLSRITQGKDTRNFSELSGKDITSYNLFNNHFISLKELLLHINKYKNINEYSAIHLKSKFQKRKFIDILLNIISDVKGVENKILIFDVTLDTAKYIKSKNEKIKLFPSVAHDYDIKRFNIYTGGTLLSIDKVIENKYLFDGVWLDEWDRKNVKGRKKLYTKYLFSLLRSHGFKIALVTPELHAKSPGLLGGESHEDASDIECLKNRFNEIEKLKPDYVCCDYIDLFYK